MVHFGFALGGVGVGLQVPNGLRNERIFVVLGRVRGLWPFVWAVGLAEGRLFVGEEFTMERLFD